MSELPLVCSAAIAVAAIITMVTRPFGWPDWAFAAGGALLVMVVGLESPEHAALAIRSGLNVYAFLAGIMLLSAVAERERLFDLMADWALELARGSTAMLFVMLFGVCVVVTAMLSNDTTAVVLTPVFIAVLGRARVAAAPFLYASAFVANAASLVFPFSNPANLLMLAGRAPALGPWMSGFGFPSVAAIVVTLLGLMAYFRSDLRGSYTTHPEWPEIRSSGILAAVGIAATFCAMIWAAMAGVALGFVALAGAGVTLTLARLAARSGDTPKDFPRIAWGVLPLVAGLLVVVDALDRHGALRFLSEQLSLLHTSSVWASIAIVGAVSAGSNALNNLPVALSVAHAFSTAPITSRAFHAAIIGVDLGPNIFTTGSLSTLLWMRIVRDAGHRVSFRRFALVGLTVGIPSLLAAALCVR